MFIKVGSYFKNIYCRKNSYDIKVSSYLNIYQIYLLCQELSVMNHFYAINPFMFTLSLTEIFLLHFIDSQINKCYFMNIYVIKKYIQKTWHEFLKNAHLGSHRTHFCILATIIEPYMIYRLCQLKLLLDPFISRCLLFMIPFSCFL